MKALAAIVRVRLGDGTVRVEARERGSNTPTAVAAAGHYVVLPRAGRPGAHCPTQLARRRHPLSRSLLTGAGGIGSGGTCVGDDDVGKFYYSV